MARTNGVTLVMGVSERVTAGPGQGTLYNSILSYGPDGALLNHHRKLMPTYTERMVWGAGDAEGLRSVAMPVGGASARVGSLVCWEHWMPARAAGHAHRTASGRVGRRDVMRIQQMKGPSAAD